MTRLARLVAVGLVATGVAGCESTQDKAAKLKRGGTDAFEQKGVRVGAGDPRVTVLSTTLVRGTDAAAVVVRMRNASARPLARLPIAIDVRDAGGRSLFRNDGPGLERSLVQLALLRPREEATWVNDQILVGRARPKDAVARVGGARGAPARPPRMTIHSARLTRDGDATVATGYVRNRSTVAQRDLVIYAVARRGGSVTGAGRAQIRLLAPAKRAEFTVFFVGDPRGARLELSAPPTVLTGGNHG